MVDMNNLKDKVASATKNVTENMGIEMLQPVAKRVRDRMKELKELSSAKHVKIMRGSIATFITTPPKMYICDLNSRIINGVGTISYKLYKMDGSNKAMDKVVERRMNSKGDMVEVIVSTDYMLDKLITEQIEYRKPIKKEEIDERS